MGAGAVVGLGELFHHRLIVGRHRSVVADQKASRTNSATAGEVDFDHHRRAVGVRPDVDIEARSIEVVAEIGGLSGCPLRDAHGSNRDADELKREREQSLDETNKRLKYVLPMLELLTRLSTAKNVTLSDSEGSLR